MIADHPLLGVGPGNFQDFYTRYKIPQASEEPVDPHNFLVEIAATAGVPAMLLFVAALLLFALRAGLLCLSGRQTGGARGGRKRLRVGLAQPPYPQPLSREGRGEQ